MTEHRAHLPLFVAIALLGVALFRIPLPSSRAQAQNPPPALTTAHWVLLHHETNGAGQTIPLWVNLEQADSIRFEDPTPGTPSAKPKANVVLARQIAVVIDPQEIELLRRYVLERQRK